VGISYFPRFALFARAISRNEAEETHKLAWKALLKGAAGETRGLAEEEPARRLLDLVASAVVDERHAYLGDAVTGCSHSRKKGRCVGCLTLRLGPRPPLARQL
jgi:hypothetical protein